MIYWNVPGMMKVSMIISRDFLFAGIIALSHFYCIDPAGIVPYIPEVTFTGYLNNIYDSLAGNREWPNRCMLVGDTVRIYCYSTSFEEVNRVRQGDLLRIDFHSDSSNTFTKYNTLFHLARYNKQNESYTINKGDSVDKTIRFESETVSFIPRVGTNLELTDIFVATPPVAQGQHLEITRGHLFGSVHRK
jgi:hypothetical protein